MRQRSSEPDFDNILKILNNEKPDQATLFEFIINDDHCQKLAGIKEDSDNLLPFFKMLVKAFYNSGYDYFPLTTFHTNTLTFPRGESHQELSRSQNEGALITDWMSFEKYEWPDPYSFDYGIYEKVGEFLPDGMKIIASGPGGVLENATDIVGYENLCYMSILDENLTKEVCNSIGTRLLAHYEIISSFDCVGAIISNDDWGFKTQTMFSSEMLRKFIFPWHKKIVEASHQNSKPAILHSCGNISEVMYDIIEEMQYDGKHSFEDQILPVESAYDNWGDKIAILGGIDLDFIVQNTPEKIYSRSKNMLNKSEEKGGYALGSGNSIPEYVPIENYLAMIKAVNE